MFFAINFSLSFFLLYPLFLILLSKKKQYPKAFFLVKIWANWLFLFPGIIKSIKWYTKKEALPSPAIYCSNHTSFLDIMYSYIIIPNYFVSIAKKQLERIPFFSILIRKLNISIDRTSKMESYNAFVESSKYLDEGVSIFLFPEGSISKNAPKLLPFKNGVFKLAIEKQLPIIPITYKNNWKLLQNGSFLKASARPGIARACVHPPILTTGMTLDDVIFLKQKVQSIIEKELEKN